LMLRLRGVKFLYSKTGVQDPKSFKAEFDHHIPKGETSGGKERECVVYWNSI
jgi:hypothetical protein